MKQIYTTKDAYQDNSVRINYFHKDAIRTHKRLKWNEETKQMEQKEIEEIYNELLFCERLFWKNSEEELDEEIKQTKQLWEAKIIS
jgi:hypothetical protein